MYEVDKAKYNEYMVKFKLHQFLKVGGRVGGMEGRSLLTF